MSLKIIRRAAIVFFGIALVVLISSFLEAYIENKKRIKVFEEMLQDRNPRGAFFMKPLPVQLEPMEFTDTKSSLNSVKIKVLKDSHTEDLEYEFREDNSVEFIFQNHRIIITKRGDGFKGLEVDNSDLRLADNNQSAPMEVFNAILKSAYSIPPDLSSSRKISDEEYKQFPFLAIKLLMYYYHEEIFHVKNGDFQMIMGNSSRHREVWDAMVLYDNRLFSKILVSDDPHVQPKDAARLLSSVRMIVQ